MYQADTLIHTNDPYRWAQICLPLGCVLYEVWSSYIRIHSISVTSWFFCVWQQGLYKSDVRYGPGIETYNDGCQDVGIWKGQHLFRLCTVLPGSISILSFPQYSQPQQSNKGYVSEDHDSITEKEKAYDPFLFRYKFLLLDDSVTLPEKIYSYSSDTDHLPITPTQHLEFDQHFFRHKDQQEIPNDVTSDDVQPNSGMRKIYLHVNKHRLVESVAFKCRAVYSACVLDYLGLLQLCPNTNSALVMGTFRSRTAHREWGQPVTSNPWNRHNMQNKQPSAEMRKLSLLYKR